jgi:hypothetical protein
MGMLLHSNEHLNISTVADWLSMFRKMWQGSMEGSRTGITVAEIDKRYYNTVM